MAVEGACCAAAAAEPAAGDEAGSAGGAGVAGEVGGDAALGRRHVTRTPEPPEPPAAPTPPSGVDDGGRADGCCAASRAHARRSASSCGWAGCISSACRTTSMASLKRPALCNAHARR
eukprot:5095333-Prymnesium_polylepis.1